MGSATGSWGWGGTGYKNVTGFSVPGEPMLFNVSQGGVWTVDIAMREDGTDFDALLFDMTTTFTGGSVVGPDESDFMIIPEPSTFVLLAGACCIALLGYLRRRRKPAA